MDSLPIVVTDHDLHRIRRMLNSASASALGELAGELSRRLDRAVQVRSDRVQHDVVTLDSQLSLEDPETGCVYRYTLTLPGAPESGLDRLSVLGPLGWQLLGRREGDRVQFRLPGSGARWVRIKRIDFQPETHQSHAYASGPGSPSETQRESGMHPEYPIERVCSHMFEPFQLTFARHARNLLPEESEVQAEASHRGLVLLGETEATLEHGVAILRDYYGNQIRVGAPAVRYHKGATLEEPHMGLRVRCSPEYFTPVRSDLLARDAKITSSECNSVCALLRATAPLARLMGYAGDLARITAGTAHEVMWLSHYAPIEDPPPSGHAA